MDVLAVYGVIGGASVVLTCGIAIGTAAATRGAVAHKLRNLDNAQTLLRAHVELTYARKDTIAEKFDAIEKSLERIEKHGEMMAQRFMNGGAGAV